MAQPPPTETPIGAGGQFTTAWIEYLESLSNVTGRGVTDGSDAAAGRLGEYQANDAASLPMVSGINKDIIDLAVGPGDWMAVGSIQFRPAVTTDPSTLIVGLSDASLTIDEYAQLVADFTVGATQRIWVGPVRFSSADPAHRIYLVGRANFTVSTLLADGWLRAWRVR